MSSCGNRSLARLALSLAKRSCFSGTLVTAAPAVPVGCSTWCRQLPWQSNLHASLASNRSFRQLSTHTQATSQLLDSLAAAKLRDQIDSLACEKPFMTYPQFLELIKEHSCRGAADTDDEAHARADALQQAGVVLRFNGVVYLKPEEIAEIVFRSLPMDPTSTRNRLEEVETELSKMDVQYKAIQKQAQRWPKFWINFGCFAVFTQLLGFSYLTWWELSWDVMEPIAYIMGVGYSLLAYIYFLYTRGSYLDMGPFKEYWEERLLQKRMSEHNFNLQRYHHLMRTRERYQRYLAAAAGAPHVGDVEEQQQQEPAKLKAA